MPGDSGGQQYIVCNSDESEPGTCHDRDILRYNPHALIEGMAIAGYATGSNRRLQLYPRRVHWRAGAAFRSRCAWRPTRPVCWGNASTGRPWIFDLYTFVGAGAYICGEETALLESLEGKPGKPRFKPPFPANRGLYGRPTTINNTQTLASVPAIIRHGADWYAGLGPEGSGGTALFSVSGHVERPGNYELPMGISVQRIARYCRRGTRGAASESRNPWRLVRPSVAGRGHYGVHDGLHLSAASRVFVWHRCRHRDGRDHLHGQGAAANLAVLHVPSPAVNAPPAGRVLDGSTACSRAS